MELIEREAQEKMNLPDWHYPLYTAARNVADSLLSIECALLNGHEEQAEQYRKNLPARVDKLRAVLREVHSDIHAVDGWISVKDQLPEPGERVLAANGTFVGEAHMSSGHVWMRHDGFPWKVIHWMPLPEPPEEED